MNDPRFPIVVLISGNGSNLQAIINAIEEGLGIEIRAVISNRAEAYGLQRAKRANIPTHVIPHKDFSSQADFETALRKTIDRYQPKLIVLAGFMRKLSGDFVDHYQGQIINIHPSLLPKYPGLKTHERVLAEGDREHGVSIHYATENVDGGPLICQARLVVTPADTPETLSERIHAIEHSIYPHVLSWFAAGRLTLRDHQVFLDNKPLPKTGKQLQVHTDKQP